MYIRADESGKITMVSRIENEDCTYFSGRLLPKDFFNVVGLGKYKFIDNQIVEVDGWVMPELKMI